jgi:hypothetical protein
MASVFHVISVHPSGLDTVATVEAAHEKRTKTDNFVTVGG